MTALFKRWMAGVQLARDMMRPLLTFFVTMFFNGTVTWLVLIGKLTPQEYIAAVGPINTMILGFWFGERASALASGKRETP